MLKNLKSVLLNSNPISDKTFVKLSTMIAKNQLSCTTLHLGETKPTIIGLIALFQSLEDDKILKNLFLNDILIPTDAAKALNKTLVRNSCLEQLNFGNCEIDDEIISLIKFGLMCNQNVKSIYLWKNCITNEGLFLIKRILEDHNFVLIGIILSDNLVDDEDLLNEVKVLLKRNEKLDNISVRLDNALQIWETINCLKDNPEHLIKAENIEKENRISVIEREINEAERKIEEAKKNLLILKQL